MRRNRLLLPWGLLAGLLVSFAVVDGLNLKPPSLLKKPRNYTTTTPWTSSTAPSTTTTSTTETPETTIEAEVSTNSTTTVVPRKRQWTRKHENVTAEGNATTKSPLSGIPQIDYVLDPNLPRELPRGYNLSEYPFFDRVPNDIDFECDGLLDGFYASIFYKCQIYHHCVSGIRYDFLCANYTAFDQRTFICQFVSEVDCPNSAKWFFRNEPLYKGRITTTSSTTTQATTTTAATRRPPAAGAGGRRRRPFRRRRPQYDYYYDEDYEDDEYDDEQSLPPAGNRQRKRQRRPSSGTVAANDDDLDDKPLRAPAGGGGGSVYDRPRVLPKIRRPVPKNEREKYDYNAKGGSTDNSGGEKREQEITERSTSVAEKEPEKPKRPVDPPAPAPEAEKPRSRPQKTRPQEDDEYYDDEDYDQPIRTSSRKNNQDYYAPSGGDRDFSRRPAMTGAGRPLRRNRPGRRKPAPLEYDDDDYEDDRRPFRPSASADDRRRPDDDRRRPSATSSRKRPQQRDDYDRDSAYDRPQSYRDTKKPQSSRDSYERPSTSNRDSTYERQATPTREVANERPSTSNRESTYERQATPSRETTNDRPVLSKRERLASSARGDRPTTSNRDTTYERPPTPTREVANERPATSSRDSVYERAPPSNSDDRTSSKDSSYERLSGNKKRTQSTTGETTYERTRPERPSSRTTPDYDRPIASDTQTVSRPLTSRNRYTEVESDEPIPAARPAYISTTGRSSFRKRGQEESITAGVSRGVTRTTPKPTEPPALLDDEEYYDDDEEEEELKEEPPKKPTGSGRTDTGSYRDTPVDSRKPSATRSNAREDEELIEEPRTRQNADARGKVGQETQEHREREKFPEERDRSQQVPATGRERLAPVNEGRPKTRPSYVDEERPEVDIDVRSGGGRTSANREQSRLDTNYRASESIIEQPPVRTSQTNYRTKEQPSEEVVAPQRQGFRPKGVETTSEASQRYNNFRRKANQASNIETTRVLPAREGHVVEIAEDVHIAPSSQGRSQSTGFGRDEFQGPVDVELKSETSEDKRSEVASDHLDTSQFTSSAEVEAQQQVTSSTPSGQDYYNNNRNAQKGVDNERFAPSGPSGRGSNNNRNAQKSATPSSQPENNPPHRIELPDINDPEYDVTLNEALHPTRPILLSTEGGKSKLPNYQYRDVGIEPDLTGPGSDKLSQTLLTSASQTHVSKAPFPIHAKVNRNYQNRRPISTSTSRPVPQYDEHTLSREEDYDDPPIPTGRGGSTRTYATTETVFRASQQQSPISLSSRGASGQQFPVAKGNNQYVQFPPSPATGTLRQLEQELAKSYPRGRVNQPPYRSPSQGTIREADLYRGSIDPISLSLGYDVDYEQATKYRPRRKLVWRDRLHDFYNLY